MQRLRVFWFGLTILTSAQSAVAAESVGMVLRVSGEAELLREAETRALLLGDLLKAGDRVRLQEGSATFLFCPTSERVTLEGAVTVELSAHGLTVVAGAAPTRTPARRCALPKVALGHESTERIGGLVARGLPPIPLFVGGAVASVRPAFAWEPVEGEPTYEVSVRDQWGGVVWEVETDESGLTYPEDQSGLEPGKYHWEVLARINGETVAQQSARFQVKPDEELATLTPENPGDRLIIAVELENAGYYSEAAAWIRALRQENPEDARLTQRLMVLYWNAGLIPAANLERARLDKINESQSG